MSNWMEDECGNPRPLFLLVNGALWIGSTLATAAFFVWITWRVLA